MCVFPYQYLAFLIGVHYDGECYNTGCKEILLVLLKLNNSVKNYFFETALHQYKIEVIGFMLNAISLCLRNCLPLK